MNRTGVGLFMMAAAVAGFFPALTTNAADALHWKFKKGDVFQVIMNRSSKHAFGLNSAPVKGWGEDSTYFTWQVQQVEKDGTAQIAVRIDRVTSKGTSGDDGAVTAYDSAVKKEAEGSEGILAALVDATFTIRMSAQGKIMELAPTKEALEQLASHPLSKDILTVRMQQRLQMSFPEFPTAAVEPSAKWQSRTVIDDPANPLNLTVQQVYEGAAKEAEVGKIALAGEYAFNPKERSDDKKLSEQQFRGTVQFDTKLGQVLESNLDYGYRVVSGGPGFRIDLKQENTTRVTVKPAGAKK